VYFGWLVAEGQCGNSLAIIQFLFWRFNETQGGSTNGKANYFYFSSEITEFNSIKDKENL
jgi:hypothetical protein